MLKGRQVKNKKFGVWSWGRPYKFLKLLRGLPGELGTCFYKMAETGEVEMAGKNQTAGSGSRRENFIPIGDCLFRRDIQERVIVRTAELNRDVDYISDAK